MKRLYFTAVAALLVATAWTGDVSAQPQGDITPAELARHGYTVPPEHVMLVVISHTGNYQYSVTCVINRAFGGVKQELGEIKAGEAEVFGVDTNEMNGKLWVGCQEEAQGRVYSSNDFQSVGHTLVHFSTGSKFVITQKIVP